MKNFVFIIVPVVIVGVVYFFWSSDQVSELDSSPKTPQSVEKKKINVVAEEKLDETKAADSFGEESAGGGNGVSQDPQKLTKQSSGESVNKYVESTGVSQEFYELDSMLDAQIEQIVANSELSDDEKDQITKIFTEHIQGEDLLNAYKAALASEFTEEELESLSELNNDPLIKRIRDENPLNDPKIGEKVSEFFAGLEKNPISPEREKMIREIATATKGADFIVDLSEVMMDNLGKHLGAKGDAPSPEERQSFREQLRGEAEASVMSGLMFQTRSLNNEELKLYKANQTNSLIQRDQVLRKGVAKKTTSDMFSEIGKIGAE